MLASSIPVNEKNYPELNRVVDECVETLNIKRPYVVVTNYISGINAVTFGSDERPYIAISSLLVKVMQHNKTMLSFVVGHECGHIAMGHIIYHTVVNVLGSFSEAIPIVGTAIRQIVAISLNAWSRRSEITADRAGLLCCGDIKTAQKALVQLESAFTSAEEIDMEAYMEQSKNYLSQGTLRKLGEYTAGHPLTPKRIQALQLFADSEFYANFCGKPVNENCISRTTLNKKTEEIIRVL